MDTLNYVVKPLIDSKTGETIGTAQFCTNSNFVMRVRLYNYSDEFKTFDLSKCPVEIDDGRPVLIDCTLCAQPGAVVDLDFQTFIFRRLGNLEYLEWLSEKNR